MLYISCSRVQHTIAPLFMTTAAIKGINFPADRGLFSTSEHRQLCALSPPDLHCWPRVSVSVSGSVLCSDFVCAQTSELSYQHQHHIQTSRTQLHYDRNKPQPSPAQTRIRTDTHTLSKSGSHHTTRIVRNRYLDYSRLRGR